MIRDEKNPSRSGGNRPNGERRKKKDMPGGLWMRCPGCEGMIFKRDMERGYRCCPDCGYHFQLNSAQRIELTLDEGSFREFDPDLEPSDPLEFIDLKPYPVRLRAAQEKTGLKDAAVIGIGTLHGREVVLGVLDFTFIGGSMGEIVGEKLARAMDLAFERSLPLIIFTGSGGARMMEGVISLMQMAKTCAALGRFQENGGLFLSVLTDPSTGGVLASFASLGDLVLAEPGAVIGFAGPRVIQSTIKQELPDGFQRAEFLLKHGFIDRLVPRKGMKDELGKVMDLLLGPLPVDPSMSSSPGPGQEKDRENDKEKEKGKSKSRAKGEAGASSSATKKKAGSGRSSKRTSGSGSGSTKGSSSDKSRKRSSSTPSVTKEEGVAVHALASSPSPSTGSGSSDPSSAGSEDSSGTKDSDSPASPAAPVLDAVSDPSSSTSEPTREKPSSGQKTTQTQGRK